jgi:uncharacterized protein
MDVTQLSKEIPTEWFDLLMIPELEQHAEPMSFVQEHTEILNGKIQELSESLSTLNSIREAAKWMMALGLLLAHAIGADAKGLSEHWIEIAKSHGAQG